MSAKEVPIEDGDSSDTDSDCEIKITLHPVDWSKMTKEEMEAHFKKYDTCAYCQSIGKDERVYTGHTKENCKILENTRCNWCGGYGHTGKYCENRGEKPLEIRCMFCFRAKMDERFYMSHRPDNCRFKREYDDAKRYGRPIPIRPRGTQPPRIIPKTTPPKVPTPPKATTPQKAPSPPPTENLDDLFNKALLSLVDILNLPTNRQYEPTSPYQAINYEMNVGEYEPTSPYQAINYEMNVIKPEQSETKIKSETENTNDILNRLKKENERMLSKLKK